MKNAFWFSESIIQLTFSFENMIFVIFIELNVLDTNQFSKVIDTNINSERVKKFLLSLASINVESGKIILFIVCAKFIKYILQ